MGGEKHVVSPRGGNDPHNKRFGCVFCTYRFRHYRQLEEHMNTHTKERPHHCDKCDLFFSAGKSLWEHNRVYHLGKKWKCLVCGKEFTSTSNLSFHKKIHGDADWWIQKTKELEKNDEDKKKGISSAFQTAVWKAISNNREEEKTEMEGEEEETKEDDLEVETAEEPPKKKLKLLLKKEVRSVGKVKRKWQCDLCGKTFKRFDDYSLKRHKRTVHKKILNPVSVSRVVTSEIISLNDDPVEEELNEGEIHLEISSVPEVGNSLEEPPPPPGQEEPEVENNLVKTKTPVPEVKISKKGKREWECQICQKIFYRSDNYSLKRHLSTVHRELNISISGIQWSKEITSEEPSPLKALPVVKKTKLLISRNKLRNLRRKRKKKVDSEIRNPCPFCGKLFTRIDSVYRHIERFHSEEQGNGNEEDFQKQVDEQEEEDDDDDADEVEEEEEPADKTGSSPLQLFTDAPIQLNLHPPCSIPFFNSAAVAADTPPQSKKEWDPSFFLHMNRYDPNKDAESLNTPPPPPPPPTPPQNLSPLPLPPPPSSSISKNLYKCDKCGHTMAHKWSLQRHQKRDSCTAPKKMFQSPLVPTLRYVCAFCSYDFNDRRFHLVRHLSGVHRFGDGDTNHQQAANQSSHSHSRKIRSDFSCVYCDERTVTKEKMQAHIARNHIHLLGIPREDWHSNSNSMEQQDGRQDQSRPPPPSSSSTQAEEQPVLVPVVTSEIIDLSDNSLSSSVGSSLIEITEDPPPPPSSPYPSDQSDESIVFIEELEKDQNPDPPPPPPQNLMENESQALTQLVDSTSQNLPVTQEIEPVLPSSSSLASQETQEIPPLSLAEAMQLDRDLGGEHTPQSMGTSTTTSASQSTAPSSPASVVSESELDTTLDEDAVSPAIPVEEEQDFHNFKVARNYDTGKPKPTTSSSGVPVGGNANETSVQFSTSSSSSSSEETHEDNELSLSTTSPPQQVAFEKEVETIIEALLPLVSRFDFDNEIVSSVQVEMVELDTEVNTEKVQQQPPVIDDHGGTGILESPVIPKQVHSPAPVIPEVIEKDLSHHSPEYKVPSPVGSEHLKSPHSPPGGMSSEASLPLMAHQDHLLAEASQVPVPIEPITSISQVELPVIANHIISPSSSPVTSEHAVLVEQSSPPPIILREHLHESPSVLSEFMEPPTPTQIIKESSTNLEDAETCLVSHSPPEELSPPSQLEYPVVEEHVNSPQTSSQSPPSNSENVESSQSITVLEESTPNSPNSPSSSIEMIDEHVHQSPSQTSPQQMELDTTTLERVDVNTLPSIPEHMEPPEHAHVTPQTVELPPTQHATPPVIPLNNEPTPSLVTFPIGSPVIISQPSTPTSPSSPIEMIDELVESPSQTSPQQMELDTATVKRVDVDTPSSIPEHVESSHTKASPKHVSATPQTVESPPMQHATSLIITLNDEATPSSVTFPIGSPVIISQPSTPNSPSSLVEMIDEHVQSSQTSPLAISEDMEREDDVDFEPPSVPEHVGQPVTPPPEFHVHAIPETVESSSTLPVITLNEEPMPSTTINSGCVDTVINSQSPSSPQSIIELEESTPNSPSSPIKMINDLGQSPQTFTHVISEDMESDDPIFERVDTPSVPEQTAPPTPIPEQMESPQTSPLPPLSSPKVLPVSPPEDEQVIPETVESPPPTQHVTLHVITSNQDSVPASISECIDSAPAPMSPSLPLLHSDTELEEGTSNSASLYVQLIEECSKSSQTSQPSPHINLEPMESDAASLEPEDSPPPPSIMASPQVLPESPPDDVHVIPETEESPPTQLVTLPAITSNQDSSSPPSISECIDSDPAPVSPPSLPLPHSDTELVKLEEPTSNSPSKFIEVIDEDIESPQESPQSSPHTNHQQVESSFDILDHMDSPASIPEYVESPPQTPPPLYATVLPPESPPEHAHVIPETVGSPPPIQHDTLPVTTLNRQSTRSTATPDCDDEPASTSKLSPNSEIEPEKFSSNSPSQSIQIIDECVESPQTSQPSSPQNIPEQVESVSAIILEHVASPHVTPERVESPQEMEVDQVILLDRVDTPSSPKYLESPQTSPQIPPGSPPLENVSAILDTMESPAYQLESFSNSPTSPYTEKIDQFSQSPQTSQPSTPINPEPMESDLTSLDREDSPPPPSIPDTLESTPIPHAPPLPTPHVELEKTPQSPIINSESVEPLPMSQSSPQSTTDMDGTSLKSPSSSIEMDDELVQSPQTSPGDATVNHVDVDAPFSTAEHVESPQSPPPSPKAAPEHPVTMSQSSPYSTDSDTVPDESSSNSPKSPFIEIIDECDKSPQTPQPSPQTNLPLPMELAPTTLEPLNSPPSVPEYVESPHTPPHPTSPSPTPLPISEEMEQDDNTDILERVDTPPSIPEYVESPPQTPPPPPPIASPTDVLPESPSPSQHDHESPPTQQSSVPPEQPAPQNEAGNEVGRSLRSKHARKTKTPEVSKPSPVVTRTSGYFCHLCPLSFEPTARGKYHLARHLAGIHRHENRREKFACIFCGVGASAKEPIQRHILKNHNDLLKLTNANDKTEDEGEQEEEEEDLSPPALQRMDEHVQDYGDEDDQLPPPLLTPFNL